MKDYVPRTVQISGAELRLPRGVQRIEGKCSGWQYKWTGRRGPVQGKSRFFADGKWGGPLESFRQVVNATVGHPFEAVVRQRKPQEEKMGKREMTTRWNFQERANIAKEVFRQRARNPRLSFSMAVETAQDECLKDGRLKPERRRDPNKFARSHMKWLVKMLDEELRAAAQPVPKPDDDPPHPEPEPDEPEEEPEGPPEDQPLPTAAVNWGVEEPRLRVSTAQAMGRWLGAVIATGLRQPEVQQGITQAMAGALQELVPAIAEMFSPKPQPSVVNDPVAWMRQKMAEPEPEPKPDPNNGQSHTAMGAALQSVEEKLVVARPEKRKVFVVGLNAHEIAEFEREFKDRLRIEFAYDNTSRDQIRQHAKSADYCFSTMPHSGSPVDAILKAQMAARNIKDHYFRIPNNKKLLHDKLESLAKGQRI